MAVPNRASGAVGTDRRQARQIAGVVKPHQVAGARYRFVRLCAQFFPAVSENDTGGHWPPVLCVIDVCADAAYGRVISSGLIHSSNCSLVTSPRASADSRSVVPSACAFFAIFAALS